MSEEQLSAMELEHRLALRESEIEKLKAENERLRKRLAGFQHNHFTRDIKDKGECPACDRHHEKAEITKLTQQNEIMKEALELVKDKAPWCGCMDASGIASTALQESEGVK